MSEDEIVAFLSTADTRGVFLCRFLDGTEVEITDPQVRSADGKSECIATVVREAAGVDVVAGESLCVGLDQVAEVRLSPKPWDYFR